MGASGRFADQLYCSRDPVPKCARVVPVGLLGVRVAVKVGSEVRGDARRTIKPDINYVLGLVTQTQQKPEGT